MAAFDPLEDYFQIHESPLTHWKAVLLETHQTLEFHSETSTAQSQIDYSL